MFVWVFDFYLLTSCFSSLSMAETVCNCENNPYHSKICSNCWPFLSLYWFYYFITIVWPISSPAFFGRIIRNGNRNEKSTNRNEIVFPLIPSNTNHAVDTIRSCHLTKVNLYYQQRCSPSPTVLSKENPTLQR